MDNRQAYMWDVNRGGVESMEYEEDKRSEGEIYSDVDSMDDYARERRGREKNVTERESDTRRDDKDRERTRDGERDGRGSRRDRSRDRDKHSRSKGSRRSSERRRSRSRDSSRGRHDRKSRSRKHKRHRRHSSSNSRSSSRSGGHSRRRRSRSYDSYGSSEDSRDYNSDYYGERGGGDKSNDSYKYQEPNSTVMVRGLMSHLTEQDIRADILKCGIMVKDIRLIRHRETGASRGFAFVEFHSVQDATRWMEMKQGTLVLQDEYHASLIYSIPKAPFSEKSRVALSDWYCTKCQGHNFKRREFCYKCYNPRPDEQDPELTEEMSTHPTSTIILYNLDALTTEEGVLQAFKGRPSLASIPIRSVRIARESVTNLSRGMCYVETNNVTDGVRLYNLLTDDAFTVDSRQVGVAYCKPAQHGSLGSTVAATALAAAQWTNSGKPTTATSHDEDQMEKMAQYSASLYAKTPTEHASYLTYYRNYYKNQKSENDSSKQGPSDPGTEPTTSAVVSVVKASSGSNAPSQGVDTKEGHSTASGHAPDTSGYQYDEASGYYYDPVSGYYYDPSTQYFYDSMSQQYLYWNQELNKYVPVSDSTASTSQGEDAKNVGDKKKEKKVEKSDKVKVAKKIAKDMEKWAKTLNQKKEGIKPRGIFENSTNGSSNPAAAGDVEPASGGESQLYRRIDVTPKVAVGSGSKVSAKTLPATPYGEVDSDSEEEAPARQPSNSGPPPAKITQPAPESLVDYNKMACLLCKRQFPNKEVLIKHTKLSDLHKKNLEELKNSVKSSGESSTSYRDRAKERRMKFGSDPIEGKNTLKDLYMQAKKDITLSYVEEPTRDGIKDDNLGNRMLQKMGWQEGQGLGKGNQGRTEIITTQRRAPNAGLGLRGMPVVDEEDDRYSRARKLTLARYQELE